MFIVWQVQEFYKVDFSYNLKKVTNKYMKAVTGLTVVILIWRSHHNILISCEAL